MSLETSKAACQEALEGTRLLKEHLSESSAMLADCQKCSTQKDAVLRQLKEDTQQSSVLMVQSAALQETVLTLQASNLNLAAEEKRLRCVLGASEAAKQVSKSCLG